VGSCNLTLYPTVSFTVLCSLIQFFPCLSCCWHHSELLDGNLFQSALSILPVGRTDWPWTCFLQNLGLICLFLIVGWLRNLLVIDMMELTWWSEEASILLLFLDATETQHKKSDLLEAALLEKARKKPCAGAGSLLHMTPGLVHMREGRRQHSFNAFTWVYLAETPEGMSHLHCPLFTFLTTDPWVLSLEDSLLCSSI
jgi:hypothetical protein